MTESKSPGPELKDLPELKGSPESSPESSPRGSPESSPESLPRAPSKSEVLAEIKKCIKQLSVRAMVTDSKKYANTVAALCLTGNTGVAAVKQLVEMTLPKVENIKRAAELLETFGKTPTDEPLAGWLELSSSTEQLMNHLCTVHAKICMRDHPESQLLTRSHIARFPTEDLIELLTEICKAIANYRLPRFENPEFSKVFSKLRDNIENWRKAAAEGRLLGRLTFHFAAQQHNRKLNTCEELLFISNGVIDALRKDRLEYEKHLDRIYRIVKNNQSIDCTLGVIVADYDKRLGTPDVTAKSMTNKQWRKYLEQESWAWPDETLPFDHELEAEMVKLRAMLRLKLTPEWHQRVIEDIARTDPLIRVINVPENANMADYLPEQHAALATVFATKPAALATEPAAPATKPAAPATALVAID